MNVDESFQAHGTSGGTSSTHQAIGRPSVESDEYASAVSAYIKEVVAAAVKAERERIVDLIGGMHRDVALQLTNKLTEIVRDGD